MASRVTTASRPRSGGARPAARKAPARKRPTSGTSRPKPSQSRAKRRPPARRGPNPLITGVGHLLGRTVRLVATGVGGATRAATGGARDLDPAHRRDGRGLLLLALALVAATGAWWHAGAAGDAVAGLLATLLGRGALLLPPVLALGAWRVLRHPVSKGGRGRLLVGWTSLSFGGLGVLHVVRGELARSEKGGLVGFLLGEPLRTALTGWVAVPVLLLLAAFGLLVVTATPVHQLPQRLALLRDTMLLRPKPAPVPDP